MKNNKLLKLQKFDTPTICNGLELLDASFKLNRGHYSCLH